MKKKLTFLMLFFWGLNVYPLSQTSFVEHSSLKYSYKIKIPSDFKKDTPKGSNIDLKFSHKDGSNITVNVTQRLSEEYRMTAHDYTKEMFQESFRASGNKTLITYSEKLIISGQNAFLIEFINAVPDLDLKMIQCFIFHNNLAFVITSTSRTSDFYLYRNLFLTTVKSLKL